MDKLVEELIYKGVLISPEIIKAFLEIDRRNFVLSQFKEYAYCDIALPIGCGQTISQPSTVAIMLELLDVQKGQKILDIGSGSGWTTVLLGNIIGEEGKVFGLEIVPELVRFGQNNIAKYPELKTKIFQATNKLGLLKEASFDRILVSAAAKDIPYELIGQLANGGRMVAPIKYSLWQIDKINEKKLVKKEFPGFVFVSLVY